MASYFKGDAYFCLVKNTKMRRWLLFWALWLVGAVPLWGQYPWAGGLNACQFGRMDLDGDGRKDLLVFDRHADRLLCFLNQGDRGTIHYQFTRAYDEAFPVVHDWMVMADYDGDGREDLFTYSKGWAGIAVYRNVSLEGRVAFEPVAYPYLTSWQGGGAVNLLATEADYPALFDMDGDGDLDILTFGVLGTFLEKHQNRSMERYGVRDSLVFERTDPCWGRVAESEENNVMYLDTCLFGLGMRVPLEGHRHRGATVTVRDLTGDGLLDLLLADVDYPELTLLINGGDADNALMVSQTASFPPAYPVHLASMPVPCFTDIDNDGVDDLLVSAFDPDPMACAGLEGVWLYLNHGTDEHPDFQLYTKSFLQDGMIDLGILAYPTFIDWDGDGLTDLVAGTMGLDASGFHPNEAGDLIATLTLFRNVGTLQQPALKQGSQPLLWVDEPTALVPAFHDLDGDGLPECLMGTSEGNLLLYGHDGTLLDGDFLHYDLPWSAPCFCDVDQDGVVDLVVGNATGRLSFFKGKTVGSRQLPVEFERTTDYWGRVDVRDYSASYYGYSIPALFRKDGELLLCVGSESGKLHLFEGVAADGQTVFEEVSERWTSICPGLPLNLGRRASPALADLNADGLPEVVVGNFAGGLQLFNADIPLQNLGIAEREEALPIGIFPNPVSSRLHIISKEDIITSIVLVDLYGREIKKQPVCAQEVVVEVSELPPGVYLLRLVCERGLVNRIFLKR